MAEYIKRETALSMREPPKSNRQYQTGNLDDIYEQGWDDALCSIEHIPVADVDAVMRCEDCKHLCVQNRKDIYAFCPKTNIVFLPFDKDTRTFFCNYGERKDEANES